MQFYIGYDDDKACVSLDKILNKGTFSNVYQGSLTWKDGNKRDVVIKKTPLFRGPVDNEIKMMQVLKSIDPRREIHLKCYGYRRSNKNLSIVMERAPIDLFDFYLRFRKTMTKYDEMVTLLSYHMRYVVKMVRKLHNRGYVHVDIKAENIVCLDDRGEHLSLIDFADARRAETDVAFHVNSGRNHPLDNVNIGTIVYQHPAITRTSYLQGVEVFAWNLYAHDIWGILATALALFNPIQLFPGQVCKETIDWQFILWNSGWEQKVVEHCPELLENVHWPSFSCFIEKLRKSCHETHPHLSMSLFDDEFLNLHKK